MNKLHDQINKKKSFLCIGLDIDKNKIPKSKLELDDPIFEFAKRIIDSTNEYACLLYTSPSPRDGLLSRMPSSA